jgi:hypothetical protein
MQEGIEREYFTGGVSFNGHYRGVVKTAAAVFGQIGLRCLRDCSRSCVGDHEPDGICVLRSFVQANLAK